MDSLYEQIAGSGYALLLADTAGVILCEKVDPALREMFARAGLIAGAEWSERREGTNGIGTCAREAHPITIHQTDHFRCRHVGLSCSAAPIRDSARAPWSRFSMPRASMRMATASRRCTRSRSCQNSARVIEKCLFLRRHRADSMLRFHHRPEFVDLLHDGAIAVAADGTIVASDMTGMKLLGASDRSELVGRSIDDIFDASYEELLAAAPPGRRSMWELRDHQHGRRYFASLVKTDRPRTPTAAAVSAHAVVHVRSQDPVAAMTLQDLAGEDPQMLRIAWSATRIADSSISVLILGPSGSGKEVFARALHLASKRARQPFVAINCAAIPETLIESELFGHVPGAFTGARREGLRGRITQSSGGSLFLDEIGDMPLLMQTRLLRVLEEQEVTPLGSESAIKVNLRVMCASHRNLREMVARGEFREDLYYRLNGMTLELPPLRSRSDQEALVRQCIAHESSGGESASIERAALERLLAYPWPGNIRELKNTMRTALALCTERVIRVGDLPEEIRRYGRDPRAAEAARADGAGLLESAERQALLEAMQAQGWNMTRVAAKLGISRNTLYRKINRHGIAIIRARE